MCVCIYEYYSWFRRGSPAMTYVLVHLGGDLTSCVLREAQTKTTDEARSYHVLYVLPVPFVRCMIRRCFIRNALSTMLEQMLSKARAPYPCYIILCMTIIVYKAITKSVTYDIL